MPTEIGKLAIVFDWLPSAAYALSEYWPVRCIDSAYTPSVESRL